MRYLGTLIVALLAAAGTFALYPYVVPGEAPRESLQTGGVDELVADAVYDVYAYKPEAACPPEVPAVRGYTFRCEALVENKLIPVTVRVAGPLGFFEVVRVGELVSPR